MLPPVRWLLSRLALRRARKMREQFHALTKRPKEVQREHLFEQLTRERNTAFGRDHHFGSIKTVDDYRKHVPISKYEYFEPYIERVKRGETAALFDRQKVLMFALTSGTTATRKFIPVTQRYFDDYRRGWKIWGIHLFEDHKELWFKTMLQLVSDWQEFTTPGANIPCGSISGLSTEMQWKIVKKTYCMPSVSGKIKDVASKYYLAWRLGLVRKVGIMVSANPSTMVNIGRFGDQHREMLIRDIHDGGINSKWTIPDEVLRVEKDRLAPNPARAKELEAIINQTGALLPKDVWPTLGLIGNWTGGSVGAYLRHFPAIYGQPAVRDIGLIASEGRMTIPIHDGTPGGILEITSTFFEFVPVAEIDSPQPTVLESHELEEGRDYYILLTTSSGLYRYNIFDVVRCIGWHERTPVLAFLNKGSSFSNLTGEKISEFQVAQSVETALAKLDLKLTAFSLAPCWRDSMPFYALFVEASDLSTPAVAEQLASAVEHELRQLNSEYVEKRDTRRLAPIEVRTVPAGFWRQWDADRLAARGGTAEQYKHPCLIASTEFEKQVPSTQ